MHLTAHLNITELPTSIFLHPWPPWRARGEHVWRRVERATYTQTPQAHLPPSPLGAWRTNMTNGTPTLRAQNAEGGGTIVCRVVDRTRSSSLHIRARVRFQQPHAASPCLDCRSSGSGSTDGCRLRRPQSELCIPTGAHCIRRCNGASARPMSRP